MSGPTPQKESFAAFIPWLIALFLVVLGAQLWVVWLYGSPLPVGDQWDQARHIFRPWLSGHLRPADLFAEDSNHRIVMTHLLDMGLISLNGRWDPMLEMAVDVFLRAIFAVGMAACFWIFFGRGHGGLICFLLLPFFALPYDGENAIWGINSLWYLVNIFGVVSIAGLAFSSMGTWRWWIGLGAAVLGLLTMASGMLAPVAIGGLLLLRAIKARRFAKTEWITFGLAALLVAAGGAMVAMPEENRRLQAHSFLEFTAALTHNLSWPFPQIPLMTFVIAVPLILLVIFYLRPDFGPSRGAELILGLALWSALNSVMIAYGRANYVVAVPGSRYMAMFSTWPLCSVFACVLIEQNRRGDRPPSRREWLLPLAFAAVVVFGICSISSTVVEDVLAVTREWNLLGEERVETFFRTGDETELLRQPTIVPDARVALDVLRDPTLPAILPPSCLPPAPAVSAGRLSPAGRWLLGHSRWILAAGLMLFCCLCGIGLMRQTMGLTVHRPAGWIALLAGLVGLGFIGFRHDLTRVAVERDLQQQLAVFFKVNDPVRAAAHARKAEETDSANQFAN